MRHYRLLLTFSLLFCTLPFFAGCVSPYDVAVENDAPPPIPLITGQEPLSATPSIATPSANDPNAPFRIQPTVTLAGQAMGLITPTPPDQRPLLTLNKPAPNTVWPLGGAILVEGELNLPSDDGQLIILTLRDETNQAISAVRLVAQSGPWRALLVIPNGFAGSADLVAQLRDRNSVTLGELRHSLLFSADPNAPFSDPDLAAPASPAAPDPTTQPDVCTPQQDCIAITDIGPAIPGQTIALQGIAHRPTVPFTVTIFLHYDDCATSPGQVEFTLYGGGTWQGYLAIPQTATGEICITARTDAAIIAERKVPLSNP